jgi:hypothetical protein
LQEAPVLDSENFPALTPLHRVFAQTNKKRRKPGKK